MTERATATAPRWVTFSVLESVSTRQCRGCGCVFAYANRADGRTAPLDCAACDPASEVAMEFIRAWEPEPCIVCGETIRWEQGWTVTLDGRAHGTCATNETKGD